MNNDLKKLTALLCTCVLFAALLLAGSCGLTLQGAAGRASPAVTLLDTPDNTHLQVTSNAAPRALVLYSPGHTDSVQYEKNLRIALEHLRIEAESIALDSTPGISYGDYDLVILASAYWEDEMPDSAARLMRYVDSGGKLLLAAVPESADSQFDMCYRSMGVVDYGDYLTYDSIEFAEDLVPGIAGRQFSGETFADVTLSVTLEESARVYAWGCTADGHRNPLIWSYNSGEGRVAMFNSTSGKGDFWRGIAAGCITALFDTFMYPVVNALCLFIDDFPSPQYESESDVVRAEYNRSAKEFYRDIWWPDMLQVAKAYGDVYTGLFVATYNDVTDPEKMSYTESATELYFGNSLLKNGYEMGAHGYNHQPLTPEGGTPAQMNYQAWNGEQDMEDSLRRLVEITGEMFPAVTLRSYVPPSNYLSAEGRRAVVRALPDLEVISGIYTNEEEEGDVYVQDFTVAQDGIAELPRVTAGMAPDDYEQLSAISALGLYGVVSHFIHPDDVFDPDRSHGKGWEELYRSYCSWMNDLHTTYPWLRALSATEAGNALRITQAAVPHLEYSDTEIRGSVEDYLGTVYFYLRTSAEPRAADDGCTIRRISPGSGEGYYLVTVEEPNFTIRLVRE